MRSARRTDLRINLADRVVGWVVPLFIAVMVSVAVVMLISRASAVLDHFLGALP